MKQKTISFICDGCGCAIDHYVDYTVKQAERVLKEVGGIKRGKKHYCDKNCEKKGALNEAKNNE